MDIDPEHATSVTFPTSGEESGKSFVPVQHLKYLSSSKIPTDDMLTEYLTTALQNTGLMSVEIPGIHTQHTASGI